MNRTDELRTARIESLVTPAELALRYPVTPGVATHVTDSRRRIEKILNGEDKRLLVIIGPCSIHDLTAAMEYATRLQSLRNQYQSRLEIVMRTYFEKPRTVVGWKGLISDPDLNGSYRVNHGLELARKLLLQVNELGVPTATEFLDMVTGQFIADLINRFELNAKIIKRRNKYVVYLKSSVGARLAHVLPKVRSTAKWLRHSPVRWVLKMVPMATRGLPWMLSAQPALAICSSRQTKTVR